MAFLTIGDAAIPCALGAPEQDSPEPVGDEARTLSGRTRRVIRGWVRSWTVTTIPMPLADAQALALVLQSPEPLRCGGDLIGGTVDCYGSLTALRHQKTADGERAVVEFRLVEAAPSSPFGLLFSARRGLPAGAMFSRGSTAWTILPDGTFAEVAANVPRIAWLDLDGDGVRETPTTLLEPAAANLLRNSCNLPASGSAWGGTSNFTVSPAASVISGQTAWRHQNLGLVSSANRSQGVGTFTGQPETASAIVENVDATETAINIRNNTAGVNLCIGRLTWATGQASVQSGTGTVLAQKLANAGPNGGPVYRLIVTATGTAGNSRLVALYPSGTSQNARAAIIHHVQYEVDAVATSPIVTTTAAVTRSANALTFPWPHAPQAMTGYLQLVCLTVATGSIQTLFQIGRGGDEPRLTVMISGAGRPRCEYRRSDAEVASSEAGTGQVNVGDLLEVLWQLRQDGRVQIEHSIDHAPPIVANVSSAAPVLADAWSGPIAGLSARPVTFTFPAPAAWIDAVVLKGSEWTIQQLRAFAT